MKTCETCRHCWGNWCFLLSKNVGPTTPACKHYKGEPDQASRGISPESNQTWLKGLDEPLDTEEE